MSKVFPLKVTYCRYVTVLLFFWKKKRRTKKRKGARSLAPSGLAPSLFRFYKNIRQSEVLSVAKNRALFSSDGHELIHSSEARGN